MDSSALAPANSEFPLLLYATGSVSYGKEATLDADDLQNDFQRDIEITEIRFMFWANGSSQNGTNSWHSSGPLVRVKLKMGRIDLTNGFVPAWLFGPPIQRIAEVVQGKVSQPGNASTWSYYRWKLPVPLIVPHGSTLLPTFQYLSPVSPAGLQGSLPNAIECHIAMVGRSLKDNLPRTLRVPYVTAWIPDVGSLVSNDRHLVNPFTVPMRVQRFLGRIAAPTAFPPFGYTDSLGYLSYRSATPFYPAGTPPLAAGVARHVEERLRLYDHVGYQIVPGMVPWNQVFSLPRAELPVGRMLEARGWYTAVLENGVLNIPDTDVPMISMVGWREEELAL